MQEPNQDIQDVDFKDVPATEPAVAPFQPAAYLTTALARAGYHDPEGWLKDADPLVATHEEEKQRIFFANRALRLYLAEIAERENISPRLLLADGIDATRWCALMDQGIVPWLMNEFDSKGKRVKPEPKAGDVVDTGEGEAGTPDQPAVDSELVQPAADAQDDDRRPSSSES